MYIMEEKEKEKIKIKSFETYFYDKIASRNPIDINNIKKVIETISKYEHDILF